MSGQDHSKLKLDIQCWDFIPVREKGLILCYDLSKENGEIFRLHGRLARIISRLLDGEDIAPDDVGHVEGLPFFVDSNSKNDFFNGDHKEIERVDLKPPRQDGLQTYAAMIPWGLSTDFPHPGKYPYIVS